MRALFFTLILFALALFPARAFAAPVQVVASIPPQKYFLEKIGGDAVAVTVMAAKGRDPHTYEPTPRQMERIAKAEIYCTIGVPFETQWVPKFLVLNPDMEIVDLLGAVSRIHGKPDLALRDNLPGKGRRREYHHDHHHGHGLETDDPHIWLSPSAMLETLPLTVAALSRKRPELAEEFSRRGEVLRREITGLRERINALFDSLERRTFLTFHQGWAYYARDFSLREASVELDGREPGPKSMALLLDFAKAEKVGVVVADPMTGKTLVDAIAANLGATVVRADPLAEDWPGALAAFSENLAAALAKEDAQ